MLLCVISVAPLLSEESQKGVLTLHFVAGDNNNAKVHISTGNMSMILMGLLILSGLYNAHSLKISKTVADPVVRLRWRAHVYFVKVVLLVLMSPVLEMLTNWFFEGKKVSPAEVRFTAVTVRAYLVLIAAGVGSYCKVLREDGIVVQQVSDSVVTPTTAPSVSKRK